MKMRCLFLQKFTILLLLLIFCLSSNSQNDSKSFAEKYNIKTFKEYLCHDFSYNNGSIKIDKEKCRIVHHAEYDEFGNELKRHRWEEDCDTCKPYSTQIVKYDDNNNHIETVFIWYGDTTTYIPIRNNEGQLLQMLSYKNGKLNSREEYYYDEKGRKIEYLMYVEDDIRKHEVYRYDSKGRNYYTIRLDENNQPEIEWIKKYDSLSKDEDDWVVREYYKNGKLTSTFDVKNSYMPYLVSSSGGLPDLRYKGVKYYEDGSVKSWYYINSDGEKYYQNYNKNGDIIERRKYDEGNKWLDTFIWEYDKNGNLLRKDFVKNNYKNQPLYKESTFYENNSKGLWIKKFTKNLNGEISNLGYREFKFYD